MESLNLIHPNACQAGAGEHLFLSEELSDVTILVRSDTQSQWRFPAHGLVLSAQSPVFRRMLESNFSEKTTRQIVVEDIKPTVVKLLLGYIYCGRVSLEKWLDASQLLQAAHKYEVESLARYCGRFLESVLSFSNVCHILNIACTYNIQCLKEKCTSLILDAGFIVLRSRGFEMLSKECVMEIISNPNLNIDSELIVFNALYAWTSMHCCRNGIELTEENILKELTPFLKHVCFDDMSDTDKSEIPSFVLSCMTPNNRNRIAHCVTDSLSSYSSLKYSFQPNVNFSTCIRDTVTCIRFSLDRHMWMIGLKFMVLTSEFSQQFPLSMFKESDGSSNSIFTLNITAALMRRGFPILDRNRYEIQLQLRQPCRLEPKAVYRLFVTDRTDLIRCPKATPINRVLPTNTGNVNLSVNCQDVWGVMELCFV